MKSSLLMGAVLAGIASQLSAAEPSIQPFLNQYCMDCHDAEARKGGLDLTALPRDGADAAAFKKWVRVFDRVIASEMPPAKKPQPTPAEIRGFAAVLSADLTAKHAAQKGTVLRRLNRREYQNTINDLLGIEVDVISQLPEDGRAHGFDNIGDALAISSVQMQRYMETAEFALNTALLTDVKPESKKETFAMDTGRSAENMGKHWLKRRDGAVVVFNEGGFPSTQVPGFKASALGTYRVSITGYGYQTTEPSVFAVITGTFNRGGDADIRGYYELPRDQSGRVEFTVTLNAGDGLKISPQGLSGPDGHSAVKDGPANYPGAGLAIQQVQIEGPILKEWPPRGQRLILGQARVREVQPEKPWMKSKRGYTPEFVADSPDPAADARMRLPEFLAAAFRHPTTAAEAEPYIALFDAEFALSKDYLGAMRTAAIAALCSPEFLYLREPEGRLDDYALATRLSYFLTRSAPDAQLLKVASAGNLHASEVLREQTERLLSSAARNRFVADFTDGWLDLRNIDFTTPDKVLYPEFDGLLLDSMLRETRSFIAELIQSNLSLANLIQSDFAMLNARLARHYGLPAVSGLALRKTPLPAQSRRGGVLTQASILKVSANGTNTSPVIRGVWVMDRILGIEPQPPPPGIPGIEPDIRGAKTMREILDKHRSMESCNGCHRVIDPPGFALESYDVIGGWRDHFRSMGEGQRVSLKVDGRNVRYKQGPAVDATGELPNGKAFKDFADFQALLLAQQDQLAKCVTEKLMTFATGREIGFSDRAEIAKIVAESKLSHYGMSELIHGVVQSGIFRSK